MTAESTQTSPRSRRALLAGALGGLGVWAASAIGRAAPAEAAAGDPIRMGRLNKASGTATTLQTKTRAAAFLVNQIGGGTAVKGVSTSGRAIMGEAGSNGTGVWAFSPNHYAVFARTDRGVAVSAESIGNGIGVLGQSINGRGVYGSSSTGVAVFGHSQTNYAGEFLGPVHTFTHHDMNEQPTPAAPPANMARIFVRDNGVGKTQLCVRFPSGAEQVIATEP
jgi:hypothetical protein